MQAEDLTVDIKVTVTGDVVEEYARVELMGHRERVGQVQEVVRFGTPMLRVDFWDSKTLDMATEFYAGGSIYCLSPVSKDVVDAWIEKQRAYYQPRPRQLSAPDHDYEDDGFDPERVEDFGDNADE